MGDNPVSSQQYKCPRCGAEPGEPCTDTLGKPRRIDHLSRRRLKMWRVTIDTIFEVAAPDARTAREDAYGQQKLEREHRLYATDDAMVWAKEWCEVAREIEAANDGRQLIDEEWMVGWFANAMVTAVDHQKRRDERRPPDLLGVREDEHWHDTHEGFKACRQCQGWGWNPEDV